MPARLLATCLLAACLAYSPAARAADDAPAAETLVSRQLRLVSARQIFDVYTNFFARSYFIELRSVPQWGPNHPAWTRHLPEFVSELQRLMLPAGIPLDAHLASELARQLPPGDLAELSAAVLRPEFTAATRRLEEVGASWEVLVQLQRVVEVPQFYSTAERERAKVAALVMRGQLRSSSLDVEALRAEVKPLQEFAGLPAFQRYVAAIGETFMAGARRLGTAEGERVLQAFLQRWDQQIAR